MEANIVEEEMGAEAEVEEMFEIALVIGECHVRLGQTRLALMSFNRALRLVPHSGSALFGRAEARLAAVTATLSMELPEDLLMGALRDVQRGIRLAPTSGRGYALLGKVQHARGFFGSAWQAYCRAVELEPGAVSAWAGRAGLLMADGNWVGALADVEQGLAAVGKEGGGGGSVQSFGLMRKVELEALLYATRGVILHQQKVYAEAERAFEKALELDRRCRLAAYNLGVTRYGRGDVVGAIEAYDHLLEEWPGDALAWNNRGLAKAVLGDYDGAMGDFQSGLRVDAQGGLVGVGSDGKVEVDDLELAHHLAREAELADQAGSGGSGRSVADLLFYNMGWVLGQRGEHVGSAAAYTQAQRVLGIRTESSMEGVRGSLSRVRKPRRMGRISSSRLARIGRGVQDPDLVIKQASALAASSGREGRGRVGEEEASALVEIALRLNPDVSLDLSDAFGGDDVEAYREERRNRVLMMKTVSAFRHLPKVKRARGEPITLLERIMRYKRKRDKVRRVLDGDEGVLPPL